MGVIITFRMLGKRNTISSMLLGVLFIFGVSAFFVITFLLYFFFSLIYFDFHLLKAYKTLFFSAFQPVFSNLLQL